MSKATRKKRWTKEALRKEAMKYSSRIEFQRNNKSAYNSACSRKLLDKICKHMPILWKPIWTKESVLKEALKYSTANEFNQNSKGAYTYAMKNKILKKACSHMTSGNEKNHIKNRNRIKQEIRQVISAKNGQWLNESEYLKISDFCTITCAQGHTFKIHSRKLRKNNSWCGVCSQSIYIGEELCRLILEELLTCNLPKTRQIPNLISPTSGHHLEIDGFNLTRKIGFEYNGRQHYCFIPHIHREKDKFFKTKDHDIVKQDFFKSRGWTLVVINQFNDFSINKSVEKIISILVKNHIPYNKKFKTENIVKNFIKITTNGLYQHIFNYLLENKIEINDGLLNHFSKIKLVDTKSGNSKTTTLKTIIKWYKNKKELNFQPPKKPLKNRHIVNWKQKMELVNLKLQTETYDSSSGFKKKESALYQWLRRNKLLYVLHHLPKKSTGIGKKGKFKFSNDELISLAKKFKNLHDMKIAYKNEVQAIYYRNIQDLAFNHFVRKTYNKP